VQRDDAAEKKSAGQRCFRVRRVVDSGHGRRRLAPVLFYRQLAIAADISDADATIGANALTRADAFTDAAADFLATDAAAASAMVLPNAFALSGSGALAFALSDTFAGADSLANTSADAGSLAGADRSKSRRVEPDQPVQERRQIRDFPG